jgi:tetratricopeptide (TPR) repeat protein
MKLWVVATSLIGALLVPDGRAHAEDKQQARAAYRKATQHYDLGEYQQALDEFKRAYRHFEDPAFLFNIAQCHRQLGDNQQAVREYRIYLVKKPRASNGDEVRALIAKLDKIVAEEQATRIIPPSGTTPTTIEPGPATPAPEAATSMPVAATAQAAPPPKHVPAYKKWWLWTTIGAVVVVAVGVGVGVGVTQQPSSPSAKTDFGTFRF